MQEAWVSQAMSGKPGRIEDHTLSIAIRDDGPERVIQLFGELDRACVGTFNGQLQEAMRGPFRSVVVDLSGLDFIDSTGLGAIYWAVEDANSNGAKLGLLRGSASVERTIAMAGLDQLLPFLD
jgi:anti-sigma B factor antagonist